MPNKIDVLRAKLEGHLKALERLPPSQKVGHASTESARDINSIFRQIGEECPEIREDLPNSVTEIGSSPIDRLQGLSAVAYVDIERQAEQALALLDLASDA